MLSKTETTRYNELQPSNSAAVVPRCSEIPRPTSPWSSFARPAGPDGIGFEHVLGVVGNRHMMHTVKILDLRVLLEQKQNIEPLWNRAKV